MKPYFQRDGITIYNGDCRDILPQLTEQGALLRHVATVLGFARLWAWEPDRA